MENELNSPQNIISADSKIEFYSLSIYPEDDQYIVGRPETGEFVAIPQVGQRIVDLLQQGLSISETVSGLRDEYGQDVDVNEFLSTFIELGFIKSIDEIPLATEIKDTATLPWLKQRHVQWLFSPISKIILFVLIAVALFSIVRKPEYFPKYSDYFWSTSPTFVVVINTVIYFSTLVFHEFAHLAGARALNIPARISLSTRLHNLVVQTDVSGLWSVPRNQRYQVYFAGISSDLAIMSTALLVVMYAPVSLVVVNILRALILICFLKVIGQFHIYMRTDMYLVCLDLLRCYNMFDDALKYAKYIVFRSLNSLRITRLKYTNPLLNIRPHETRTIKVYSLILVIGSIIALSLAVFYEFPVTISLILRSISRILSGLNDRNLVWFLDGLATLIIESSFKIMFIATFIKKHPNWFNFGRVFNKTRPLES